MKRSAFEDGDVFEIFLTKKLSAYSRIIGRNEYSPLSEIFEETFSVPQNIDEFKAARLKRRKVLFINQFSLKDKKKARFVGNLKLTAKTKKHPPIFRGSPGLFWRLETPTGSRPLPTSLTYEELIARGYVDCAIYATESVVAFYLRIDSQ